MKRKIFTLLLVCVLLAAACGCTPGGGSSESQAPPQGDGQTGEVTEMKITINGIPFTAAMDGGEAAQAFARLMPLELTMSELNGNEKYCYLDEALPQSAERPGRIEAGDIMLWGDDCVVIFYKSFRTSYSYTRLGRINETDKLAEAVGAGSVRAEFEKE